MQITKQADYAVRALAYLAELQPGILASTSQISERQHIPPTFLAKIVSQLSVAGLLRTSRGARGGVALAKPASEISLLEVVEAIDGPIALNECTSDPGNCPMSDDCNIRLVWCEARADLVRRLSQTTFGQLARDGKTEAVSPAA
jgi:Rrf2 family protein